jgi:hypothetical protein
MQLMRMLFSGPKVVHVLMLCKSNLSTRLSTSDSDTGMVNRIDAQ